jgi:2,3,4,5-tetrahydropyridine-2,6-dicarboxylate N-succinyltransferase
MTSSALHSFGFGLTSRNSRGEIIEVYYPHPQLAPAPDLAAVLLTHSDSASGVEELNSSQRTALESALLAAGHAETAKQLAQFNGTEQDLVMCLLAVDQPPQSVAEAYLKLHLLSHRLVKPHELNLDGLFSTLHNLAWTNEGAIDLDDLPARQLDARKAGKLLDVMCVDKFPKMTNYVVPRGTRIADTARVRLGAYIGEGTTIMHEGFVNFNAGTLGAAMIEGRISAGVVVGENSDLGGGCSTMGTLSGGGTQIISVGKNCLIGANAGIGFPLADGCIVEAGLYVTAGTKVNLLNTDGSTAKTVKALDLSSLENHLFRRNSLTGAVECSPLKSSITLNEELHSNN